MNENICRLCLQTVSSNNCQAVEESLLKSLKLNPKISKENVMCIECANCLQVLSNLASGCVYMRDTTLPLSDLDNGVELKPEPIEAASNLKSLVEVKVKCSFCTRTPGREDLTSLRISNTNKFLVNMLEQYISETNLKCNEELLTCGTCLEALEGVLSVILKCLEVEEKINKYVEIEGTDDDGQVELKKVQQFTFKPIIKLESELFGINKFEGICDGIQDEYTTMDETEIKSEKQMGYTELIIKTEDDDIKPEQRYCDGTNIKSEQSDHDGFQEPFVEIKNPHISVGKSETSKFKDRINQHPSTQKKTFQCDICPYVTKHKGHLNDHLLIHKSPSEITMFKCELCTYKTKRRYDLKNHSLTHKSPSEINMFKCAACSHETKHKQHLTKHLLTHKNPSEIEMFKCDLCMFETKHKCSLKIHLLTHKNPSEVKTFKCASCSYETRHKHHLKTHLLTHKSSLEIMTCFEKKHKYDLNTLMHEIPSEIKMFKCESCSFETKHKYSLKMHLLTHKSPSEIEMFKCELCSYETKHKNHIQRHLLTHKSPLETKMFKCASCLFETKRKCDLKRHLLTHKSPLEVKMFKCESCFFETKYKHDLKSHSLTHKSPAEIKMFKCESCSYEAKKKSYLRIHLLTHKNPSQMEMFKCTSCSYEAKRKQHLKQHLLTHKSPLVGDKDV